jgi:hypothetical protein
MVSRPHGGADADLVAVLVRTLEAHLAHGCVISRTSGVLGVHRSTVRYRLHRIRELTGLDPESPAALSSLRRLGNGVGPGSEERRGGHLPDPDGRDVGCGDENSCSSS